MRRKKGTRNTPQAMIDEIIGKHKKGKTTQELATEYKKPLKTVKNMITRENNKKRSQEHGKMPTKYRGRKPAATLAEYKYENKRLRMENELLRDFLCGGGRG
jgi:hypothetical protein